MTTKKTDEQDPLPEARWLYRRIFTYSLTIALIVGAWIGVDYIGAVAVNGSETAIRGLVSITKGALWLVGLLILFYLLAPSAEQLTRLIQTGAALRSGVAFRHVEMPRGGEITRAGKEKAIDPDREAPVADEALSEQIINTELPVTETEAASRRFPWSDS